MGKILTSYFIDIYDSWGNTVSVTDGNGNEVTSPNHIGNLNPIRYRGYYLDRETGYYYLQSRYYNPDIGRFLNADVYCDTGTSLLGTNMFAYCNNNPIMYVDSDGFDLTWATVFDIISTCLIIDSVFPEYRINPISSNSLPIKGKPNSNQTLYNNDGTPKQKRWYDSDGNALRDRDYGHSGKGPFPHDHDWKDGKRGKEHLPPSSEYKFSLNPLIGAGLTVICIVGMLIIVLNDVLGIGVLDDFLFAPLSFGIEKGVSLVTG